MTATTDPSIDWVGAEFAVVGGDPCDETTVLTHTFATELELAAWVAEDPVRRVYRGAQWRLDFG